MWHLTKNWRHQTGATEAAPQDGPPVKAQAADARGSAQDLSALLNPSGYERERALLGIGPQHASAAVWQAVLLRLNDWVPQVRAAAWQAFEKLLPQLDLDTALQLLPALAALERGRRAPHGGALDQLRQGLRAQLQGMDEARRQPLHALARRGAPAQARFAFDALLNWAQHEPAQTLAAVLASGLAARQADVSRRAVQWVGKLPDDAASAALRQSLYAQALRSPHIRTRLAALRALGKPGGTNTSAPASATFTAPWPAWLQAALLDRSPSVRYAAILLCGGPGPALLAHARAAWQAPGATPRQRAAALGLLADLALPEGRSMALNALHDSAAVVRRAAYAAAYRLQAQAADALSLRALQDPARAVFRVALLHAQRSGSAPTLAQLAPHLHGPSADHWQRLLQLAALGDAWGQLIVLLSVPAAAWQAADAASRLQPLARQWLHRMPLHVFVPPSSEQRQRIQALLPAARPRLLFGAAQAPTFHSLLKDWQLV